MDGRGVSTAVLISAIQESFSGAARQRRKVHFMRNILARVPQKEKDPFAAQLKEIRLAPSAELARQRARLLPERSGRRFPKTIEILEEGLEDSLAFYAFAELDARKISSANILWRLNREIRRRTDVVGIFPNPDSYLRLVTSPDGIYRGRVCFKGVFEPEIHSDTAAKRGLMHSPESQNCGLLLTRPNLLRAMFAKESTAPIIHLLTILLAIPAAAAA